MLPILTRDEAQALLTKVLSYSTADECQETNLSGSDGANIRYAPECRFQPVVPSPGRRLWYPPRIR